MCKRCLHTGPDLRKYDQPGHYSETLSLEKMKNIIRVWWRAPVVTSHFHFGTSCKRDTDCLLFRLFFQECPWKIKIMSPPEQKARLLKALQDRDSVVFQSKGPWEIAYMHFCDFFSEHIQHLLIQSALSHRCSSCCLRTITIVASKIIDYRSP